MFAGHAVLSDKITGLQCIFCQNKERCLLDAFTNDNNLHSYCSCCKHIQKIDFYFATKDGTKFDDLALRPCICGNKDEEQFTIEKNEHDGGIYLKCKKCWNTQGNYQRKVPSPGKTHLESLPYGKFPSEKRKEVTNVRQLQPGDHIAWTNWYKPYWHHAIVEWIDYKNEKIHVIHYYNTVREYIRMKLKTSIRRDEMQINDEGDCYLFHYGPDVQVNSPEEVLKRADSRVDEKQFWIHWNNCEHFARWCKTGTDKCLQMKEYATMGAATTVKTGLKTAAKATASLVTKLSDIASQAVAGGISLVAEISEASFDIYQTYKKMDVGHCDYADFERYVIDRICRAGIRITCTTVGGIIGELAIPIPVLGTAVGATVGSLVGWLVDKIRQWFS